MQIIVFNHLIRQVVCFLVLCLLVGSRAGAQQVDTINEELLTSWEANWISHPTVEGHEYGVYFFKRNFILKNLLVLSFFLPIYPSSFANTGDFRNKYLDNSNRKINFQEDLYILGPGDKLVITVLGSKVTSGNYDVMNDGSINMPLVGDIMLRGKTLPEASNEIKRRLSDQIISPEVSIKLDVPRPVTIFVLGEVESPGLYVMTLNRVENGVSILGHPTVVYAIQNAGGITQKADLSEVELLRLLPGNKNEYKK